jgi:gliding motility-associated-like protein
VRYKPAILCLIIICGVSLSFVTRSLAQITLQVDDSGSIQQIVQALQGPNVTITNVSINGDFSAKPAGRFNDPLGLLDVHKGLLMTCGKARYAIGPNNSSKKSWPAANPTVLPLPDNDADLESVVPGEDLYDVISVEFDITVSNSVLSFSYIFGSEEYPEYEHQYNDVFGFFISGPGIAGVKNLAVTNTGVPVSVKSINTDKNSNFYVSNGDGSNPAKDFYVQYDGFTKKLVAQAEVIPCETYHIKLAIADAGDEILDSGVFIEEGSFTSYSKLDISTEFEYPEFQYAVEGCNKGYFVIKKNLNWIKADEPVTLEYTFTGTATKDTDYTTPIPSTSGNIIIPAGQESIKEEINAIADGLPEGTETVTLSIVLKCGGGVIATASATIDIKDEIEFPIESKVCGDDVLMPINTNAPSNFTFTWDANPALSCTNCTSPKVALSSDATFSVLVHDNISGCEGHTNAVVTVDGIHAYFTYYKNDNYPSTDAFFHDLSTGAETYDWDFGDGQKSNAFEPLHTYQSIGLDSVTYKITLNVSSLNGACQDEYDATIVIPPFYIPNVVTPNDDSYNEQFVVKGIEDDHWSLKIYNRWGTLVYHTDDYENNWEARNVPSGVYYFKLSNHPGDRVYKGWINVIK